MMHIEVALPLQIREAVSEHRTHLADFANESAPVTVWACSPYDDDTIVEEEPSCAQLAALYEGNT